MTSSITHSLSPQFRAPYLNLNPNPQISLQLNNPSCLLHSLRVQASRRVPNFPQEGGSLAGDPRNWGRTINSVYGGDEEYDDDDEDDEEEDRSLDLLVRFVQNVFKKISKRARKAVRSVLPFSIPTSLVGFSVNGVLMLAFLWVSKAFLEVICTLGTIVFVSILIIRGIWAGITYIQESRNQRANEYDGSDQRSWNGAQPAS